MQQQQFIDPINSVKKDDLDLKRAKELREIKPFSIQANYKVNKKYQLNSLLMNQGKFVAKIFDIQTKTSTSKDIKVHSSIKKVATNGYATVCYNE